MYQITKKFETETGHRLLNYNGKCAHLHGHRYQWEVTISAPDLDATGFVIDFKDLKAVIERVLEPFDHALCLRHDDPLLDTPLGTKLLNATNGEPGRLIVMNDNPTVEHLTRLAGEQLSDEFFHTEYHVERVKCHETTDSYAEWINPVARVGLTD